jgi:hypothetical protein
MRNVGRSVGQPPPSERNKTGHLSSCRPAATGLTAGTLYYVTARGWRAVGGCVELLAWPTPITLLSL